MRRKILFIYTFLALSAALVLITFLALKPKFQFNAPQTKVATAFKAKNALQNFQLTDTTGKPFTPKSLRGHWSVLFFGYMRCPDICPQTLGVVRESWEIMTKTNKPAPRFIFVDISIENKNINQLQQFLQNYNPDFIGLSGTSTEIKSLGDQLGIYSKQLDDRIDHSAALMLIDPLGRLHAILTPPFNATDVVHDLTILTL